MEHEGKMTETDRCICLLDVLKPLDTGRHDRFSKYRGILKLGHHYHKVQYI
jgi:hypothetical protein